MASVRECACGRTQSALTRADLFCRCDAVLSCAMRAWRVAWVRKGGGSRGAEARVTCACVHRCKVTDATH